MTAFPLDPGGSAVQPGETCSTQARQTDLKHSLPLGTEATLPADLRSRFGQIQYFQKHTCVFPDYSTAPVRAARAASWGQGMTAAHSKEPTGVTRFQETPCTSMLMPEAADSQSGSGCGVTPSGTRTGSKWPRPRLPFRPIRFQNHLSALPIGPTRTRRFRKLTHHTPLSLHEHQNWDDNSHLWTPKVGFVLFC